MSCQEGGQGELLGGSLKCRSWSYGEGIGLIYLEDIYMYRLDGWVGGLDQLGKGSFSLCLILTNREATPGKLMKHTILMMSERASTDRGINSVNTLIREFVMSSPIWLISYNDDIADYMQVDYAKGSGT